MTQKITTLEALIKKMLSTITEDDFKKIPGAVDVFGAMYHHGFGTNLRNKYNLWTEDSAELKADIWENMTAVEKAKYNRHWEMFGIQPGTYTGKNMHADDASAIIMDRLWYAAKEKYQ